MLLESCRLWYGSNYHQLTSTFFKCLKPKFLSFKSFSLLNFSKDYEASIITLCHLPIIIYCQALEMCQISGSAFTTMQWGSGIIYRFLLWYVMITMIIVYLLFPWPMSKPLCCQREQFHWLCWVWFFLQIQVNPTLNFAELAPLLSHVSLWGQEADLTQPQPSSSPCLLYHFVSSRHVVLVSPPPVALSSSPRPLSFFHSILFFLVIYTFSCTETEEGQGKTGDTNNMQQRLRTGFELVEQAQKNKHTGWIQMSGFAHTDRPADLMDVFPWGSWLLPKSTIW